jgi:hypothetical protein
MSRRFTLLSVLAAGAFLTGCSAAGGNGREVRAPIATASNCTPAPDGAGAVPQLSRDRAFH